MVHEVRFDVPGVRLAAGDTTGGDVAGEGVGLRWPPVGKPGLIAAEMPEHAGDGGDTDAAQLVHKPWGEIQLTVLRQMSCHSSQDGLEALGAREVEGLGDQPDDNLHFPAVGAPTLAAPRLTGQVAMQAPDQGLTGQVGDLFGLREQCGALRAAGLQVAGLDQAQVLEALSQGHSLHVGHGFLSVTLSFEGTVHRRCHSR